jgi:hypothetical protein
MGFPPPLVPHINCEPRRPLPTERWDWVVCRNALWVNRLWSAIYPYHTWGLDRSLPRPHLARRQERRYTAHRSPKRGPLQCLTRIGPPKGTLTSSARKPFSLQKFRPLHEIDELAYKLSSTLMVGFKNHGNLTLRQKNFNVIVGIFKRFNDSAFCAPRRAYTVTPSQYVVLNTYTFYFNKLYLVTLYTLCSYFLEPHTLVPNQPQPTVILSKSRVTIERAYALLKGRFRRLKKNFF